MKRHVWAWTMVLVVAMAAVACGGGDKKEAEEPVAPADDDEPEQPPEDDYMVPQEALDTINGFLERQRKFVARCWTEALDAKEVPAEDTGRITIDFVIETNGSVDQVKVTDISHKSKTLESCVIGKTKLWKITTLEQPLEYSYTFGFQRL